MNETRIQLIDDEPDDIENFPRGTDRLVLVPQPILDSQRLADDARIARLEAAHAQAQFARALRRARVSPRSVNVLPPPPREYTSPWLIVGGGILVGLLALELIALATGAPSFTAGVW